MSFQAIIGSPSCMVQVGKLGVHSKAIKPRTAFS